MHGDLIASVFNRVLAMSSRQRDEVYGGPVLLIGVLEGRDLPAADRSGTSDPYCRLFPVDFEGNEVKQEKAVTRTVRKTINPDW
jgi:Ca2+-dependent lipid-binding protein